jgi:hypothetical protein
VRYYLWWFLMRFAAVAALFLFYIAHPFSKGQTPFPRPPFGDQGAPVPPLVSANPGITSPSPEDNHKQLLADVQELITEAQTLQQDLKVSRGRTVTAQSFKRSQKIESLSKRIRKTLKAN